MYQLVMIVQEHTKIRLSDSVMVMGKHENALVGISACFHLAPVLQDTVLRHDKLQQQWLCCECCIRSSKLRKRELNALSCRQTPSWRDSAAAP
jgi:hypothetical protein